MLVVQRKKGEQLVLLDAETQEHIATITVKQVHGTKVRLGIKSDRDHVLVLRAELQETDDGE